MYLTSQFIETEKHRRRRHFLNGTKVSNQINEKAKEGGISLYGKHISLI